MKKLVIIAAAFLFMAGYTASAQMMGQSNKKDQKQSMMMQQRGIMQGGTGMLNQNMPMKKYGMMVNRLPNM